MAKLNSVIVIYLQKEVFELYSTDSAENQQAIKEDIKQLVASRYNMIINKSRVVKKVA